MPSEPLKDVNNESLSHSLLNLGVFSEFKKQLRYNDMSKDTRTQGKEPMRKMEAWSRLCQVAHLTFQGPHILIYKKQKIFTHLPQEQALLS